MANSWYDGAGGDGVDQSYDFSTSTDPVDFYETPEYLELMQNNPGVDYNDSSAADNEMLQYVMNSAGTGAVTDESLWKGITKAFGATTGSLKEIANGNPWLMKMLTDGISGGMKDKMSKEDREAKEKFQNARDATMYGWQKERDAQTHGWQLEDDEKKRIWGDELWTKQRNAQINDRDTAYERAKERDAKAKADAKELWDRRNQGVIDTKAATGIIGSSLYGPRT